MNENDFAMHNPAKIKVVGIGGGGCNAIDRMIEQNVQDVEYIALNTDAQALTKCHAPIRLQIGASTTTGKGAGGNPTIGLKAAEESAEDIKELLEGADMVFIASGLGGGTGTGGAPVVAKISHSLGALTVAVVTKPFNFEGGHRLKAALEGIALLHENVDAMIVIPNDRLLQIADKKATLMQSFLAADEMLKQGIQGITEIISETALINVDFEDVRAIMGNAGTALMAIGVGKGENRAAEATAAAIKSSLLETSIDGAKGVLYMIKASHSFLLNELNEAGEIIKQMVDPDANIKCGVAIDDNMGDEMQITIIATGFDGAAKAVPVRREAPVQRIVQPVTPPSQQPTARTVPQPASQGRTPSQTQAQTQPPVRPVTPSKTPPWKPSSSNIIDFTTRTPSKPGGVTVVDDEDVPDFLRRSQQGK
ncbi:MAG: cell division protein FtsZ [Anaerolineae bacterium]